MLDYIKTLEKYIAEEEKERKREIKKDDMGQALYLNGIIAGLAIALYEYKNKSDDVDLFECT